MKYGQFVDALKRRTAELEGNGLLPRLVCGESMERVKQITLDEGVSLLVEGEDDVTAVSVIAKMTQINTARGVCVYALALDALGLGNIQWRNGILGRLHLTDGRYQGHATQTDARGWQFAMMPRSPAGDLLTISASRM